MGEVENGVGVEGVEGGISKLETRNPKAPTDAIGGLSEGEREHREDASGGTGRFDGKTTGAVLRMIGEGEVRGREVPCEVRRRCVSELTYEGFSISEIAGAMGVSERTVERDRAAVREEGKVGPGKMLGDVMLGEFERMAGASMRRLMRLVNDGRTPAYARLWAEGVMMRTQKMLMETAMRMGYYERGEKRLEEETAGPAISEERVLAALRGLTEAIDRGESETADMPLHRG